MSDSTQPRADSRTPFQKFTDGLSLGVAAPKEEVKKRMEEDAAKKQQDRKTEEK